MSEEARAFHDGRAVLFAGDCLVRLDAMAENSVDACVTDPPYHLTSIVKRFKNGAPVKGETPLGRAHARGSAGFMGKEWDGGDIAFDPATWAKVLRVMKPGAHLLAFAAAKNAHRMICAIEDAGFEIRDCVMWLYANGFPKSLDVSKAMDRAAGATEDARAWDGWGTALKPAYEPICLARKPLSESSVAANVRRWGTGAINVDACRVGFAGSADQAAAAAQRSCRDQNANRHAFGRFDNGEASLAPYLAAMDKGRWPANVAHDGSPEVLAAFPDTAAGHYPAKRGSGGIGNDGHVGQSGLRQARFFFSAKADAGDRIGSKHPTVKPVDLMRWCVRMICPRGGLVIDPFGGTGTTAEAALLENMQCWLIERESEYRADIARRLETLFEGAPARLKARIDARGADVDHGPLFGGLDGTGSAGGATYSARLSDWNRRYSGRAAPSDQSGSNDE